MVGLSRFGNPLTISFWWLVAGFFPFLYLPGLLYPEDTPKHAWTFLGTLWLLPVLWKTRGMALGWCCTGLALWLWGWRSPGVLPFISDPFVVAFGFLAFLWWSHSRDLTKSHLQQLGTWVALGMVVWGFAQGIYTHFFVEGSNFILARGPLGYRNSSNYFLAFLFPLVVMASWRGRAYLAWCLTALIPLHMALYLTRGAWLGLFTALVVLAVYAFAASCLRRFLCSLCLAVGGFVLGLVLGSGWAYTQSTVEKAFRSYEAQPVAAISLEEPLEEILQVPRPEIYQIPHTENASFNSRWTMWTGMMQKFLEQSVYRQLIGFGWGGVGRYYYGKVLMGAEDKGQMGVDYGPNRAHNEFLEILWNFGWLGLGWCLGLPAWVAWVLWRRNRKDFLWLAAVVAGTLPPLLLAFPLFKGILPLYLGMAMGAVFKVPFSGQLPRLGSRWLIAVLILGLLGSIRYVGSDFYMARMASLAKQGDATGMMEAGTRARALYPFQRQLLPALAQGAFQAGYVDVAEAAARQYLWAQPWHLQTLNTLAALLEEKGQLADAEVLALRSYAVLPNQPRVLYLLGQISEQKEEWQRSLRYYLEAAMWAPGDASLWLQVGIVSAELGDIRRAEAALRRFRMTGGADIWAEALQNRIHALEI